MAPSTARDRARAFTASDNRAALLFRLDIGLTLAGGDVGLEPRNIRGGQRLRDLRPKSGFMCRSMFDLSAPQLDAFLFGFSEGPLRK